MIRPILEFLIERSRDEGKQPPRWLQWMVERDPELRSHRQQAQQLDALLRSTALSQRHQLAAETVARAPQVAGRRAAVYPRPALRLAWLGAAAAILVAGLMLFDHYLERQTKAEQVRLVTRGLTAVPSEMLSAFSEAAQVPQALSPWRQVKIPEVNLWSDVPRSTQGQLKQSFNDWGSQLSAMGEQVYERLMIVEL